MGVGKAKAKRNREGGEGLLRVSRDVKWLYEKGKD